MESFFLLERAGVAYEAGRRPFQTIVELDKRRDALVHARHESFDVEIAYKTQHDLRSRDPEIYSFADEAFLTRAFADAEHPCDELEVAAHQQLGEYGHTMPHAFRGAISRQGGLIIKRSTNDEGQSNKTPKPLGSGR